MNRMLVVSTCRNSCCGCLRPPCGGTEATVPSISFSRACCTPSPDTSRVIDGLSALRRDLVDLVDIDDAALRRLDVVVGCLQQLQDDILDIFAHIAGFGQRGRVGHGERHIQDARQRLRQQRLAAAGGTDSRMLDLANSTSSTFARGSAACSGCAPPPTAPAWPVPGRSHNRRARSQMSVGVGTPSPDLARPDLRFFADDVHAQFDAFIADEHCRTGNQLSHLMLAFAAKRTVKRVLAITYRSGHLNS